MESSKKSYRFGPYQVNARECVLLRDGQPVPLTPKAFDTLLALVSNGGHLVEKDELMNQVWPETSVEESNLTQNIFTLRRVLGESDGNSKFIETVPRRGYRFVASVTEVLEPDISTKPQETNQRFEAIGVALETQTGSLAILPFINTSDDESMELLSDGITESIIKNLSQLRQLRVMSRNTVFRYKNADLDARQIGQELGVDAVLVGSVRSLGQRLVFSAELVDVVNGWQLWGESYERESGSLLDVQEEIANQISAALRVKLTGDEEQRVVSRYTESPDAYEAYLRGRYHWSKYTKHRLESAIVYFRRAIEIDPTYALAYAGIVDCYLRLATNYLPSEDLLPEAASRPDVGLEKELSISDASLETVKLRYEWDQKSAEREMKRANELKSDYPAAHQWYAAYQLSRSLYENAGSEHSPVGRSGKVAIDTRLTHQYLFSSPTHAEELQVRCMIAREQIDAGNYEAGRLVLQKWWAFGEWPSIDGLSPQSSADLLLTTGALAGWIASTRQVPRGQKHAEALLNGAVALFKQLSSKARVAEGRIELAHCYYRQGLYDLARATIHDSISELSDEYSELRSLALIRSAGLERNAGQPDEALDFLHQAAEIVELAGPWINGRYHLELATTLKEIAILDRRPDYFERALKQFHEALHKFEAIGNHRYAAIVENNYGYLLLKLKRFDEAENHLSRARKLFDGFGDKVCRAQVDETLAQLNLATERFELARQAIGRSVETLEIGGEEALLAESLTTYGKVLCRLVRPREAKRVLDRANRVAEGCGDTEGAARALLTIIEEMGDQLEEDERSEFAMRLKRLLEQSQQASILERLQKCLGRISETNGNEGERSS